MAFDDLLPYRASVVVFACQAPVLVSRTKYRSRASLDGVTFAMFFVTLDGRVRRLARANYPMRGNRTVSDSRSAGMASARLSGTGASAFGSERAARVTTGPVYRYVCDALKYRAGCRVLCDERIVRPSQITRAQLAPRFRRLTEQDLTTSSALIQAIKPV